MTIQEGKPAPAFTLPDQDGKLVSLADFEGKQAVLLYFYPKDDTPGCTKEACGFRDDRAAFETLGVTVLGVSADAAASHTRFIKKFKLPFSLLSDPDRKVMKRYGAFGEKVKDGQKTLGVIRSSVLIGKDGTVLCHWPRVEKAEAHPVEALAVAKKLLG
jgi:peroxiredoxin Q/BCP